MKQIILVFILILFCTALFAQTDLTPQQIKNKMTQIRENTDWSDPVASKKANEEIKKLSKQLMMSRVNNNPTNQTDSVHAEIQKENIEAISDQWNQIMEASKYGKNADILLGKPIREEIVEAYREDESPKNITMSLETKVSWVGITADISAFAGGDIPAVTLMKKKPGS